MKLKLLPLLFSFLLINTSAFAAIYPQHLLDNPNYQLIYANHDTATYVDLSSVIIKLDADGDLVIAVNEVTASFLYDPVTSFENFKSISSPKQYGTINHMPLIKHLLHQQPLIIEK